MDGKITGAGLNQVLTHNHDTDANGALDKTSVALPGAELKYETTDLHNHWHFQRAARYSLWNDTKTSEIDASSKVGFCFLDIGHGDPNYNPVATPTHPADDPIHFLYSGFVAPKTFGEQHQQLPLAPSVLPGPHGHRGPAADPGRHGNQHRMA